jgi:hypothetical protein
MLLETIALAVNTFGEKGILRYYNAHIILNNTDENGNMYQQIN